MKVFAISDLHLSTSCNKPMVIFGDGWQNHFDKIKEDWLSKVTDDDIVLIGGDVSWGINLDEAESDYNLLLNLPGKKIVVKGNHDYYWNSLSKLSKRFPAFTFIQNNCYKAKNIIIAGSRGWNIVNEKSDEEDIKIFKRELIRLELSLVNAKSKREEGDKLLVLTHFPPFDADFKPTEVTALFERFKVDKVVYGHLHGKSVRVKERFMLNGIEYIMSSCDIVGFKLMEIL